MYSSYSSSDESSSSSEGSSDSDSFSSDSEQIISTSGPNVGQVDEVDALVGSDGDDSHDAEGLELTVEQLAELGVPESGDEGGGGEGEDWWVSPDDVHDPRLKEKPVSKSWANLDPEVIGKPPSPQDVLDFIDKEVGI
eukprot:TRINITY_DN8941_c2_g1_i6.p1 TRINITY_DN8941_c2_g1~~TRINITY_DN8941_c2_g1_i6.p1  ORF type:complete len:138 (+),score=29.39 TRINITY_DN8941_c2_g1_i6:397-810(+)